MLTRLYSLWRVLRRYAIAPAAMVLLTSITPDLAAQSQVSNVLAKLPAGTWHYFAMVPLRDGVRLATDIYVPPGSGTWPCVMMRTAYGREFNGIPGYAGQLSNSGIQAAFVVQDMRGDGDSEGVGTFDPFNSENEINDGYDAVEWCATQSWCNSRVGIFGGSGHGMCAAMAYLAKPPHLVVVNPGNTAGNTMTAWAFENRGRRWAYRWLTHRGATINDWPKPTTSTYDTSHWQALLSNAAVNNTTVYLGDDGWWNFFHNGNFEYAAVLAGRCRYYLEIGPRTHGTFYGRAFPSKPKPYQMPDFFDVLAGTAATSSFVAYYHLGDAVANLSNEWRIAATWPPPATPLPLYLHPDGAASFAAPTNMSGMCAFSYHPTNPAPTIGGAFGYGETNGFMDQRPLTNRTDVLRFVTPPLAAPLDLVGPPRVELYFSTDVPDSLFVVKLLDIYPDGFEGILTESACMARYWQGLEAAPAPVPTGSVCHLAFALKTTAVTFLPGHRIGVLVTSSSDPAFAVHPNTYTQVWSYAASPTAHHALHTTATAPSQLVLPMATVPESALLGTLLSTALLFRAAAGHVQSPKRAHTTTAATPLIIYADATTWAVSTKNNPQANVSQSAMVKNGKNALAVVKDVTLTPPAPVSLSGYDTIEFWAHGGKYGTGAKRYGVYLNGLTATFGRIQRFFWVPAGKWVKFAIPLNFLGNPPELAKLSFGPEAAVGDGIFLDDIRLGQGKMDIYYPQPALPEMFVDGGFEAGGNGHYTMGCKSVVVAAPVHCGKGALRIWDRGDRAWSGPNFEITRQFFESGPGVYELSAWFLAPKGGKVGLAMEAIYRDPLDDRHGLDAKEGEPFIDGSSVWRQVQCKFSIRTGRVLSVLKINAVGKKGVDEFVVDDVSMKKVADLPMTNGPAGKAISFVPARGIVVQNPRQHFVITALGKRGTAPGAFNFPQGLCLDAHGQLLVADTDNHRIQTLRNDGTWEVLGKEGSAAGEFRLPRAVAMNRNGTLFVGDSGNYRLQQYRTGTWTIVCTGRAGIAKNYNFWTYQNMTASPLTFDALAFSPTQGLLGTEMWKERCWQFADGHFTFLTTPGAYLGRAGDKTNRASGSGVSAGMANFPKGIAADAAGNVYLADTGNHRIQKRTGDGTWTVLAGMATDSWVACSVEEAGSGTKPGRFYLPMAVTADALGNLYVADTSNHRIQIFDATSSEWLAIGQQGSDLGEFNHPTGIAVDGQGAIYVTDTRNHRIVVLKRK